MKITKEDVEHIAKLAKLHFETEGIEKMQNEMNKILEYIEKLNELDTSKVEPLSHVIDLKNVFREDVVNQVYSTEELLKNAPSKTEKFFRVPKVIG
ncbi:MAG TPA: Asp-tRNA(Asn)/Glu-tRNA(Gln) amidotransferase subunit GatC [Bacteroidota bacterium]|nr:Asp-tRNA(Asn)/Glu-tRNA(Gln) amidotransferase subunit GatC [Bacteroidota bacterium]